MQRLAAAAMRYKYMFCDCHDKVRLYDEGHLHLCVTHAVCVSPLVHGVPASIEDYCFVQMLLNVFSCF